jgi:citrate lyase beta subunit
MSRLPKLLRSALFAPADRSEVLMKAFLKLDVDVTVVDIEDAVSPHNKIRARDTAVESISLLQGHRSRYMIFSFYNTIMILST